MYMEKKLEKLYEENIYPSLNKFWNIVKQKQLDITYDEVKDFIDNQPVTQIFRVNKHRNGSIKAWNPKEKVQMDIVVMDKFGKSNNGNKYILVLIDVFTRKGYAIPMKTKSINDTTEAFELFCENYFVPVVLNSDNDSSFMGKEFQNVIKKYDILMIENDVGNHRQLGVIDRFIQILKNDIYKHFKYQNTTNWIDILPKILKSYNETPKNSLNGIKPENAHLKENVKIINGINFQKMMEERKTSQPEIKFKVGDKVRKKVKTVIKNRSYNPSYSTEIFTIEKLDGNKVFLNGLIKPVSTDQLQLIPQDSIEGDEDVLRDAFKADKVRRALNKVGIDVSNITIEKRRSKPEKKSVI